MSSQFNIRNMPPETHQQIEDLRQNKRYTQREVVLDAISRRWIAFNQERGNQMSSGERRACVISVGLPRRSSEIKAASEELRSIFKYVQGEPHKGEFNFICAGPRDLTYDEAFIVCQQKYHEVGWVYADSVGYRERDDQPRFVSPSKTP